MSVGYFQFSTEGYRSSYWVKLFVNVPTFSMAPHACRVSWIYTLPLELTFSCAWAVKTAQQTDSRRTLLMFLYFIASMYFTQFLLITICMNPKEQSSDCPSGSRNENGYNSISPTNIQSPTMRHSSHSPTMSLGNVTCGVLADTSVS